MNRPARAGAGPVQRATPEAGALPLISVAGLMSDDRALRSETIDAIGDAAASFGFFRLCNHGIDPRTIERTYRAAERFFALPDGDKLLYYIGKSSNHRGYVPFTEKGDYPDEKNRSYEAFDLGFDLPDDDPDYLAGNRLLGPNVWPALPGFKEAVSHYYARVAALGQVIATALEYFLGLRPGAITGQMDKPISQLRLLHYVRDRATTDSQSVNMGAHTDYECLTLLHTRNPGLQVMTTDDVWIDVPVDHGVYVVNIGDMLEAWSNGILRSTPHRVLNTSPERFSMPYFVAANHDAIIKPFPETVSAERPDGYEPFTAGAHLERMLVRDFPYLRSKAVRHHAAVDYSNPFEGRLS